VRRQLGMTERVSEVTCVAPLPARCPATALPPHPLPPAPHLLPPALAHSNVTHDFFLLFTAQAGMAQIRQLASLLTQQQQQVLPPFLSQLQSPAPRVPPSPTSSHGTAASRAVIGEGGGDTGAAREGGGDSGGIRHPVMPASGSSHAAAASRNGAGSQHGAAAAPGEDGGASQEPSTPAPLRSPLPQSPAASDCDRDDAEAVGAGTNVSGSSDDGSSDA
jgi:hypothetical protein